MSIDVSHGYIPRPNKAQRMRLAREHRGLDTKAFADEIGVSRQSVMAYERGAQNARPVVMRMWAMATGVDLDWLETGQETTPPPSGDGAEISERPRRGSNPRPTAYNVASLGDYTSRRLAA